MFDFGFNNCRKEGKNNLSPFSKILAINAYRKQDQKLTPYLIFVELRILSKENLNKRQNTSAYVIYHSSAETSIIDF